MQRAEADARHQGWSKWGRRTNEGGEQIWLSILGVYLIFSLNSRNLWKTHFFRYQGFIKFLFPTTGGLSDFSPKIPGVCLWKNGSLKNWVFERMGLWKNGSLKKWVYQKMGLSKNGSLINPRIFSEKSDKQLVVEKKKLTNPRYRKKWGKPPVLHKKRKNWHHEI